MDRNMIVNKLKGLILEIDEYDSGDFCPICGKKLTHANDVSLKPSYDKRNNNWWFVVCNYCKSEIRTLNLT